jgi:hypothetical protein
MQLNVMCNLSYAITQFCSCMCRMQLNINCKRQLQNPKFLLRIVVTNVTFLHLVFYVNIYITFWIIFVYLKYIRLYVDFKKSFKKKTPPNIGELQHMKHICDEIILVMEYENLYTYFKSRVVGGIFW